MAGTIWQMRITFSIIGALAMMLGGLVVLSPDSIWIGLLLILTGSLLLFWEIYILFVGKGWIPAPKIALTKATLKAYERTEGKFAGLAAETTARDIDSDVHAWYAIAFTNSMKAKLYGRKPPSRKLVVVPPKEIDRCGFKNEASELVRWLEKDPIYTELAITRAEFRRCLSELKKWCGDD